MSDPTNLRIHIMDGLTEIVEAFVPEKRDEILAEIDTFLKDALGIKPPPVRNLGIDVGYDPCIHGPGVMNCGHPDCVGDREFGGLRR